MVMYVSCPLKSPSPRYVRENIWTNSDVSPKQYRHLRIVLSNYIYMSQSIKFWARNKMYHWEHLPPYYWLNIQVLMPRIIPLVFFLWLYFTSIVLPPFILVYTSAKRAVDSKMPLFFSLRCVHPDIRWRGYNGCKEIWGLYQRGASPAHCRLWRAVVRLQWHCCKGMFWWGTSLR